MKALINETPSKGVILKEKGLDISEMQKIQMQKIEELVLYVIQLSKENEALKKRIELMEKSK
ncbi:MAG TPA: hypothetical protein PK323_09825 [Bacteroidia bacterium]|nr:hypothetical protein [Bacteroidia bacterium]